MCPIIKSCFYDLTKYFFLKCTAEDIKHSRGKRDFNLANITEQRNMSGKCIIVPREQEPDGRLPVGRPCSSAGLAQPRWQHKGQRTQKRRGQGGVREHKSSLYCTFRVSLLGMDMEHSSPLAWVGTPSPSSPSPSPLTCPTQTSTSPLWRKTWAWGCCAFDKHVD